MGGSNAENCGDHPNKFCMNNSVEALIPFNEGHQGLLKLHVHLGWGVSVLGKNGLCYVPLLQRSPLSAGFCYGNLIFGIRCYSVIPINLHLWPNG